ncbi:MAG: hypothetical protein ABRQ37_27080, partial [Candidatus Eremiobacterota bacterium]
HNLFEELLPYRKKISLKLLEHIEACDENNRINTGRKKLEKLPASFQEENSLYGKLAGRGYGICSANVKITIGVVSANIKGSHSSECIERIKNYTDNYELIVLDNNYGPGFNHPREMNRIISVTKSDYLVLMDDDVYVEEGWLDGLLRCVTTEAGVITPLHNDKTGKFSYGGIVFKPDKSGDHGHIYTLPDRPVPTISLCSAILLIDMTKCGHIRFDETYTKYFLDIDYGLRIWEAGYQIICSPYTMVTHLAGGTLKQGGEEGSKLWEAQKEHFKKDWIDTGRLEKLENTVWREIPEIK